jgi:hypothetical protein
MWCNFNAEAPAKTQVRLPTQQQTRSISIIHHCPTSTSKNSEPLRQCKTSFRHTMNDDPEDNRAQARSAQGTTRELHAIRKELPDPSRGGCRGHPVWLRKQMIVQAANGEPTTAHTSSVRRWEIDVHARRMTGNKQKEVVTGFDQFLLAFHLLACPDCLLDEAAAFICNNGGGICSRQDLSFRLKELNVTGKKGSTEACQAFLPQNVLRVELFFSEPLPFGISGLARRKLADFDEFGIAMQQTNQSCGHSDSSARIRKPGHCCRDTKLTVLCGVEPGDPRLANHVLGSVQNPRRWVRVLRAAGTAAWRFLILWRLSAKLSRPTGSPTQTTTGFFSGTICGRI